MFNRNDLVEWQGIDGLTRVVRLLDVSPEGFWIFDMEDPHAWPDWRSAEEFEDAVAGGLVRSRRDDVLPPLMQPDQAWTPAARAYRDRWWAIIQPIIEAPGRAAFIPSLRGPLTTMAAQTASKVQKAKKGQKGIGKQQVIAACRRYWRRGQVRNALLPDWSQCGAPGQKRVAQPNAPKRGLPNRRLGEFPDRPGINADQDVIDRCLEGYKLFCIKGKYSKSRAWELTCEYKFRSLNDHGVWEPSPPWLAPTKGQFLYIVNTYYSADQQRRHRLTPRQYEQSQRPKIGNATTMAEGPGSLYLIDATIADVYLVGTLDRTWIVGRPVVYMVQDVFSRLIVGFWVGLEGPSWIGAMMAFDNACADKIAFADSFGIPDADLWWPAKGLPEAVLADHGEWAGKKPEHLIDTLGVRIAQTPPYDGAAKGIIERRFGVANQRSILFTPGAVRQREFGAPDHRLDATLTLREFTKLLILDIRDYNSRWIQSDRYPIGPRLSKAILNNEVDLLPYDLWDWGIRRKTSKLRTVDRASLRINLLPHESGSAREDGIHFQRRSYDSAYGRAHHWFTRHAKPLTIAYDPRAVHTVYALISEEPFVVPCTLTQTHGGYSDLDWWEAEDIRQRIKNQREEAAHRSYVDTYGVQQQIIQEATQETAQARAATEPQSNAERTRGIGEHRAEERARQAQAEAFVPAPETKPGSPVEVPDEDYIPAKDTTTLLAQLLPKRGVS